MQSVIGVYPTETTGTTSASVTYAATTTRTFDGGPSGTGTDWGTAANWSGDLLPGPSNDVVLPGLSGITFVNSVGTVNVNSITSTTTSFAAPELQIAGGTVTAGAISALAGPLKITSGTITGAGDVTVSGFFTWNGGTVGGVGTLTVGNLQIDANGGPTQIGKTLLINGSGTLIGGSGNAFAMRDGAVLNISRTGGLDIPSDADFSWPGGGQPSILNQGLFRKTTSAAERISPASTLRSPTPARCKSWRACCA